MRTIVHLSDLHFNRVEDELIPKLVDTVRSLKPNVVAVGRLHPARPNRRVRTRPYICQIASRPSDLSARESRYGLSEPVAAGYAATFAL